MNRIKSSAPQKGTIAKIILVLWIVVLTAKVFFFPSSADDLRERLDRAEARMASLSAQTGDVAVLAASDVENRVRRLEEKLEKLAPADGADHSAAPGSTPPTAEKPAGEDHSAAKDDAGAGETAAAAAATDAPKADADAARKPVKKKTASIQSGKKPAAAARSAGGDIVVGENGAKYYRVSSGDTLYQISRRFGPLYGLTVDELRKLNKLAPGAAIYPGQKLLLSPGKDS